MNLDIVHMMPFELHNHHDRSVHPGESFAIFPRAAKPSTSHVLRSTIICIAFIGMSLRRTRTSFATYSSYRRQTSGMWKAAMLYTLFTLKESRVQISRFS